MATPDGTSAVGSGGQSGTNTGAKGGPSASPTPQGSADIETLIQSFYDAIASTDPAAVRASADALIEIKTGEALAEGVPPGLAKQAAEGYVAELLRGLSAGLPVEAAMQAAENLYAGAVQAAMAQMQAEAGDTAVTDLIEALASGKGVTDAVDHAADGSGDGAGSNAAAKAAQDAFVQGLTEALAEGLTGDAAIAFAADRATAVLQASQVSGDADALMQALSSGTDLDATMSRLMGDATQGMDPAAAAAARDAFQRGLTQALDQGGPAQDALADAATISQTAASMANAVPTDPASALAWALASGGNVDAVIRQIVGTDGMTPDQIAAATRAFQETLTQSIGEGQSATQAMRSAETAAQTASNAADATGGDPMLQALASGQNVAQTVGGGGDAFANALAQALASGASFGAAMTAGGAAAAAANQPSSGGSDLLTALASGQGIEQVVAALMGGNTSADATRAFETALGNDLGAGSTPDGAMQTASAASNTAATLSGQGNTPLNALASGTTGTGSGGTQTASNDSDGGGLDIDSLAAELQNIATAAGGNPGQGGGNTGSNSGTTTGGNSGSGASFNYSNPFTSSGTGGTMAGGGGTGGALYTSPSNDSGDSGSDNDSSGGGSSNTPPPANVAPTATADSATGHENQTLTIPVLGNDSDPDGPGVTLVSATLVSGAGTIQTPGGQILYNPGTDYDYLDDGDTATVTVRYTIQDSAGAQATTTATIRVTGTNDAPVVALAAIAEDEDVPVEFSAAQFSSLFSDVDANDTLASIQVTTLPTQGALQLRGVDVTLNQEIATADLDDLTYVPGPHNNGSDSFEWRGSDGTAYSVDAARFDLTLGPVNDAPTVSDPSAPIVAMEDGGVPIGGISIGDIDVLEGDGTVTVTLSVDKGAIVISTGIPDGIVPEQIVAGANGSETVTITAPLAAINATLAHAEGLSYRTAPGDETDAALTVTVDDLGNAGAGGALVTTKVIPIDVVPVSDPPVLTTDYAPLAAAIRVVQPIASGSNWDHHFLRDFQVTVNGEPVPFGIEPGAGIQVGGGVIQMATGTYREFFIRFEAPAEADIALSFSHKAGDEDPDAAREGLRFDLQVGGSDYAVLADRSSHPDFVPGNGQPSAYAAQSFAAHYAVQPDGSIDFSAVQGLAGGPGSSVDVDYVENATVPVDDSIAIGDVDSTQLTGAWVTIVGNFTAGEDVLSADVAGTAIVADYDPATGMLRLTGTDSVANYQQVLRSVAYRNDSEAPSTAPRTIGFQVSDSPDGMPTSAPMMRTVMLEAVNDAPETTVAVPTATGNEDTDIAIAGISVADVDAGGADISVTLTVGQGVLTLATAVPGGLAAGGIAGNGSGTVTLTGSAAQINATLAATNGLVYRGNADFNGSDTLSIAIDDLGNSGSGGALAGTVQTVAITVDPVNDAPVTTVAVPTATGNEDSDIAITGVSVADLDAGGADLSVTLTVGEGVLTLATAVPGGLAADGIAGNGSGTVTLTGSAAQINATLAATNGLVYRGDADFNGSDTLSIAIDDLGNSGSGGALAGTVQTVAITVDPVNDAPVTTVAVPTATGTEDSDIAITGVSVADLDAGGADLSVTLTVGEGVLTLATAVPGGLAADGIAGNGSGTVTLTGSAAQINATLAAANGLVYRGDADFNGSDTLSIAVDDLGNSGSGGALAGTVQTVAITVDPVNDAPAATVAVAAVTGDEDSAIAITGVSVADIDAGGADISVTLTVGQGALVLAAAVPGGLAADEIAGNGSGTVTLTGSAAQINATLAATNGLVYRGAQHFNGSDTLSVAVNDLGNSGAGGALAGTVRTVAITVDAVNDAPTATAAVAAVSGNEDANIAITGVSVADIDAGGTDVSVVLTVAQGGLTLATDVVGGLAADEIAGNGSGTVTLTGSAAQINATLAATGGLVYRGAANFNGSDTLLVAVNDLGNSGSGGPLAGTVQRVTITVDAVNDAPAATAAVPTATGNEDSAIAITGVSVADVDAGGADISVTLTVGEGVLTLATGVPGGLAAGEIAGNGSGAVTLTGSVAQINATLAAVNGVVYRGDANFNGSDTLSIAVNDLGNSGSGGALAGTVRTVAITVDPVNDAPTLTPPATFPVLVAAENFEAGATGWSNPQTVNGGAEFTSFLGNFGTGVTSAKTFTLPANAVDATIRFDFYAIDSWDNETFRVFINGVQVAAKVVPFVGDGVVDDGTFVLQGSGTVNRGFLSNWSDRIYKVTIPLDAADVAALPVDADGNPQLTLGFASTLNSPSADESWGIDNLVIEAGVTGSETPEDVPLIVPAAELLSNAADIDGSDVLSISAVSNPVGGTVSIDAGGDVVFTPTANFNGAASFDYTVSDGNGGTVTGTHAVQVAPVNDAPTVASALPAAHFGGSTNSHVIGTNFAEMPTGDFTLEFWLRNPAANGEIETVLSYAVSGSDNELLVFAQNGNLYAQVNGANGFTVFTPLPSDGGWHHITMVRQGSQMWFGVDAQQTAGPLPGNGAAMTAGGTIVLGQDQDSVGGSFQSTQQLVGDLGEVRLWNGVLSLPEVQAAMNGTVDPTDPRLAAYWQYDGTNGRFTDASQNGNDLTIVGTVTAADGPANADDTVVTAEGMPIAGALSVTDVDSSSFTYSVGSQGDNGVVSVNAAGQWTYAPDANFNGTDSFVLRVQDSAGAFTDHTISVDVTPINVAPVLSGFGSGVDVLVASENFEGAVSGWSNSVVESSGSFTKFLGRFAAGGATEKSFTLPGGATEATVQFNFYRIDSWDNETFQVLINGSVAASKVFGQNGAETSDGTFVINNTGNLGFGGAWIDQIVTVTLNLDAAQIAALPVDANGQPILKLGFASSLDQASSDESWGVDNVTIRAVAADGHGFEDVAYVLPGADLVARAADGDPEDTLFLQSVGNAANGNVSLEPDGTVVFTPRPDFTGAASFDYTIADGNGGFVTGTYSLYVANDDDPVVTATASGGALQFHGFDAAAGAAPQMAAAMGAGTFASTVTIELMVNFSDLQNVPHHQNPLMLSADDGIRPRFVLEMGAIGTGVLSVFVDDNDGANGIGGRLSSAATVGADEWHHVAFSYDGTTARLYLDGAEVSSAAIPGLDLGAGPQSLTLGADNGNWSTNSMIDEVRLWNVVRTPGEIASSAGQQLSPTESGLVAYYRADDSTDGIVRDLTGNGRDGVLENGAEVVRVLGPAVELDGGTDHVRIADAPALNMTAEATFEAWVRFDSMAGVQGLVMKGDSADWSYHFQFNGDRVWFSTAHSDGTFNDLASTTALVADRWYHVAGVFDDGLKQIYINGVLDAEMTVGATALRTTSQALVLGAWDNGAGGLDRGLDGTLSDVRIWDVARSADEIADSYNTVLSGDEDGLVAYYRFDGDGSVVADASGNGHDGTLVGGTGVDTAANVQGSDVTVLTGHSTTGLFAAADAEDGVALSVASGPASGSLAFDADTGRWTYHAADSFAGTDSFVLRATDSVGHTVDRAFDVTVVAHSAPPFVAVRGAVTDNFDDGVLDSSMWMVVPSTHSSVGSVTETGGAIQLVARDHLVTADEFKPSDNAPLIVTGVWRFGNTSTDFMQVLTRSDGISAGHYGETQNGIHFGAVMEWDSIAITGLGAADGTVAASAPAAIGLHANTAYAFEIYDDGTNLRFTLTEMGNAANTATVTAVSSYDAADNHVVFHNREDTWHTSSLDDVSIEHGFSQAMQFSGANGAVVVGDDPSLSITQSMTLEAWVNPDEVTGENRMILSKFGYEGGGSDQRAFQLYVDGAGEVRASLSSDGTSATDTGFFSGITLTPGSWAHVAMVYDHDAGTVSFYENGVLAGAPQAYDGGIHDSTAPLVIGGRANDGASSNNANLFDGLIDDVRVWNDARSADEIAGSYNRALNGNEQGLAGYWTFDEATGGTVTDLSANANDGTIEGGGAWRADMMHVQIANNEVYRGLVLGHDPEAGPLTYTIDTGPEHGDVVFDDNSFVYTHHGDNNDDSFSVSVTDQHGQTTIHTVDVNVV